MEKLLILSIIAGKTSFNSIEELIKGCDVFSMGGSDPVLNRNYYAETILNTVYANDLVQDGRLEKAQPFYADGVSMLYLKMLVPEKELTRVEKWIADDKSAITEYEWMEVGNEVNVETKDGVLNIEFPGRVIGFKSPYIQVEDLDGDVFDVESEDVYSKSN
jgi:hypothetical protein